MGRFRYTPTPTAVFVIAIALVAYAVAFAFDRELGMLPHLIAALATAVVVLSFLMATRALVGLNVTREMQGTAFDGDDVELRFTVTNESGTSRSLVEISNAFYATLATGGRAVTFVAEVAPRMRAHATARVTNLMRGEYVFPPPALSSGDPFGLFVTSRELSELEWPAMRLTVFPRSFPIERLAINTFLARSITGLEPTNQVGTSGDFMGTREYRPGDSVRSIHWPLSARMGELIVKEFERNASTEVTIFLDLDSRAAWGFGREHTLEYAIRIAASVGEWATQRGNAVQLVGNTGRWVVLPPGQGPYHHRLLMHYLATVQPVGTVPFHHVIRQMASQLREGSSAVMIFPSQHLQLDMFGPAFESLWARRVQLTAIMMDVESFAGGERARVAPLPPAAAYLVGRGTAVSMISCGGDLSRQLSVAL